MAFFCGTSCAAAMLEGLAPGPCHLAGEAGLGEAGTRDSSPLLSGQKHTPVNGLSCAACKVWISWVGSFNPPPLHLAQLACCTSRTRKASAARSHRPRLQLGGFSHFPELVAVRKGGRRNSAIGKSGPALSLHHHLDRPADLGPFQGLGHLGATAPGQSSHFSGAGSPVRG